MTHHRHVRRFAAALIAPALLVLGLAASSVAEGMPGRRPPAVLDREDGSVGILAWRAQPGSTAQEEFLPVSQLPPEEQLPAAPLLVAAYAFVWVALLGYLWSIWNRIRKVEQELADVGRKVSGHDRRG